MIKTSFPDTYLTPLTTALGPAWPRPRVRRIMEDLENVQKRMMVNQQMRGGITMTPKDKRQARWKVLVDESVLLEQEMNRLLESFKNYPAAKEQFKRPDAELSDCCDQYVSGDGEVKCNDCGRPCKTYTRLEREDWNKEYADAMNDRKVEAEKQVKDKVILERKDKIMDRPTNPLQGGFLISVFFLLFLTGCSGRTFKICTPDGGRCVRCADICTSEQIESLYPDLNADKASSF